MKGVLSLLFALHRAFEDDDCLAVIEQCPNTSARPPGPSLVTVQMEPTSLHVQGDPGLAPDNYSVTVETYPEPVLDTKVWQHKDSKKILKAYGTSMQFSRAIPSFLRLILLWKTPVCPSLASSSSVLRTGPVREEIPAVHARMLCLLHHPHPPALLTLLHHPGLKRAFVPH